MLFTRVKPLDQILETAERKSLKRQLASLELLAGVVRCLAEGRPCDPPAELS